MFENDAEVRVGRLHITWKYLSELNEKCHEVLDRIILRDYIYV